MQEHTYEAGPAQATAFSVTDTGVCLSLLLGMLTGLAGRDEGPRRARGLVDVVTNLGHAEADPLRLVSHEFEAHTVRLQWQTADCALCIESEWICDLQQAVWSRRDTVTNQSNQPITLSRYLARVVFTPSRYEVYSQGSRWSDENQGMWQALTHSTLSLGSEGGRTCQSATPYLVLRECTTRQAVAFHLLPCGNWTLRASAHTHGSDAFAVVELGIADSDLHLTLAPDETFHAPEIVMQAVPLGKPHLAAPALHRYLLVHDPVLSQPSGAAQRAAPVVYNTWFDVFEVLDVPRLRRQLEAARALGCEVFTIDAGWYGASEGHWWEQTGDWREKLDAAFHGRMADFAAEVRAAGLGFGIWIEPERIGPHAPILHEHPDWFLPSGAGPNFYPNLEHPEARAYMRAEIGRLIETYQLAWMKIDFNHELGPDPSGAELWRYYAAWYALLDELSAAYPQVYFEGCASGGMRSDSHTLQHFGGHFLSDTVNPFDVLRIYQGALLRALPGRWCKWLVLRSAGQVVPRYLARVEDAPETLLTPAGAVWEPSLSIDLDFAARVALCGLLGLSGDIASLSPASRERLSQHIAFYKAWREFIAGSVAHLLTPPEPKTDRSGWVAFQLSHPQRPQHLLFVYRLDDAAERQTFYPRDLSPALTYTVRDMDQDAALHQPITGAALMQRGLDVRLPNRNRAAVLVLNGDTA
jgi:alpha-galactosidase